MAFVVATADDEKVGDNIVGAQVKQEDVLSLAVLHQVYDMMSQV